MNQTHQLPQAANAPALRIAVITAQWHADIVAQAHEGLLAELQLIHDSHHDGPLQVQRFEVPGAFEMPLHAQRLAASGHFDAIVACALVVDGGIYRHDFVAAAVVDGLMRVQLGSGVPVLSVSLTPKDFHGHEDHQRFYTEHFVKKGAEAARACVATVRGLRAIDALAQ